MRGSRRVSCCLPMAFLVFNDGASIRFMLVAPNELIDWRKAMCRNPPRAIPASLLGIRYILEALKHPLAVNLGHPYTPLAI